MNLDVSPTKFEAVDLDLKIDAFQVNAFDECSAEVVVSILVNSKTWPVIAGEIQECLAAMKLKEGLTEG